jgi:MFS family permease
MSTVSRWFDKKRGLALGIAGGGGGVGQMIMAPFATYLIVKFDWRTAYIVVGLMTWLVMFPVSRLLKRGPCEIGLLPDGVKLNSLDRQETQPKNEENNLQTAGLSLNQAFRTRSFWLCGFSSLALAFCMLLVLIHIVPHAMDLGFSDTQAALTLSIIGGSAIAGRVLMGIWADRVGRKPTAVITFLIQAGAMVWLLWAQDLWMLYLVALVYGFANGGLHSAKSALTGDIFGVRRIGTILGILEVGFAIGAALGPFLAGLLFDVTNSYDIAFLTGALFMVMGALVIALTRREVGRNT